MAVDQVVGRGPAHGLRSFVVGKPLAEIDRLMLAGEADITSNTVVPGRTSAN
jgi:hypothetical protein